MLPNVANLTWFGRNQSYKIKENRGGLLLGRQAIMSTSYRDNHFHMSELESILHSVSEEKAPN